MAKQHLIMTPVNIIPVHPGCHSNSKALTRKCLPHLVPTIFSAARIGMWYESLWRFNGLSVPKGNLIPPQDLPLSIRLRMFNEGRKAIGLVELEEWLTPDGVDIRGIVVSRWAGKTRGIPKLPKGLPAAPLYEAIATGYWLDYLEGIIG